MNESKKHSRLLLLATPAEKFHLPYLKPLLGTASCAVSLETPTTFYEIASLAKAKGATAVITTNPAVLSLLLKDSLSGSRKKPSLDNYQGSIFKRGELEILILNPLEQLFSVPYGKFITSRFISKLTAPEKWLEEVPFNWSICDGEPASDFSKAFAIAIDIETFSNPPSIRCVGYTALFETEGKWDSRSIVIPCNSGFNLAQIRAINNLPVPKIFQNGKYDLAYLQSYASAPIMYLWDTAEMMHSLYSELPKDLAFLNSFFVRNSMYWKDLAETSDLQQYYLYNAKDTWATACVFLSWFAEAPLWARANYGNTFPLQYPCHLSEMTGIARDMTVLKEGEKKLQEEIAAGEASVNCMLGQKYFNVGSPKQMMQLLKVLGCNDLTSADEKNLNKAKLRHPLNGRILNSILKLRKAKKLVSTYMTPGKEFHGHLGNKKPRILYALNPHGTDTGRLASKEHHFWCGLQIQNIPRGSTVKRSFVADPGFVIAECDLEQAESRDTAHIVGDENLIAAVSGDKDFHSFNASAFFGVPYDSIWDSEKGKTKDKILRDLAKRVNHGANYNMGAGVLVETMGLDKIWEAQRLLKLPKMWQPKQVAEYLLAQFHKTYPRISDTYYPGVIHTVSTYKMLVSKATHDVPYQAFPTHPLARYCFGDPRKNKSDLNAYVAHAPQSLNAMTLNRAYMRVFYELALPFSSKFKLLAQIHDSILFQFEKGRSDLAERVKLIMEIPVTVTGYDGKQRTFTVPSALKAGSDGNGATNWGETEP